MESRGELAAEARREAPVESTRGERPRCSRLGALVVAATATALVAAFGCGRSASGPSVLVVTLDTLRRDHVGAYGDDRGLTPNLDALAAEGLVHDAAFTTMPTTAPAHVSLFTGLMPSEHGVQRNGERLPQALAGRELARLLRRGGYATAAVVTSRLTSAGVTGLRGFAVYDSPRGKLRHGDDAVAAALAWLDVEARRPVFLWVHLYDPHAPYGTADEKRLSFPVSPDDYGFVAPARWAGEAERAEQEARYARGVRAADHALGRLLEGVRERLDSEPLVIAVADHGESFTEHLEERGFAYDHGKFLDVETLAIPLILAGPGVQPGRSAGAVSIRDLYGTILAATALDWASGETVDRDLRRPSAARRIVRMERRRLANPPEAVRRHAAAAADGTELAIVGEDGRATASAGDAAASADLLEAARAGLGGSATARPSEIDAETKRALRELGYAE